MAEEEFKEMELWEHLAELRTRIIRSLIYIVLGGVLVWIFYDHVWELLWAPMKPILAKYGAFDGKIQWHTIWEPFTLRVQISLVGGLIVAVPLITFEIWGFVAPGLTRSERKGFYFVGPLAVLFFISGLTTSYLILPAAFNYFAQFITDIGLLFPTPTPYIMFLIKMCLAFGIVFELPVVLMFLAWVGIVTSGGLKSGWRYAIVGCAAIAAVATPSADALSMLLMAAPLMVLYLVSIALVRVVERVRDARASSDWQAPSEQDVPPGALPTAR